MLNISILFLLKMSDVNSSKSLFDSFDEDFSNSFQPDIKLDADPEKCVDTQACTDYQKVMFHQKNFRKVNRLFIYLSLKIIKKNKIIS